MFAIVRGVFHFVKGLFTRSGLIGGVIIGIGSFLGNVVSYVVSKGPGFAIILSLNIAIFALTVSSFYIIIDFVSFLHGKINYLINYLNHQSNSGGLVGWFIDVLSSTGFINAFADVFNLFSPFISVFLVLVASSIVVKWLIFARESALSVVISLIR